MNCYYYFVCKMVTACILGSYYTRNGRPYYGVTLGVVGYLITLIPEDRGDVGGWSFLYMYMLLFVYNSGAKSDVQ